MHHTHPTCRHCIYWTCDRTAQAPTSGHCHRYPPSVVINPETGIVVQKFPSTDHVQWCGEWNGDRSRMAELVSSAIAAHLRDL